MKKNAQGLSLNTVVIASIVLIVLVVLVGIFTGHIGGWIGKIGDATKKTCSADQIKPSCNLELETQVFGDLKDSEGNAIEGVCCRPKTCLEIGGECVGSGDCSSRSGGTANRLDQGDKWCKEKSGSTPECCRR